MAKEINTSPNNIKWCGIQMLTGGMYLGTKDAVGKPADFLISYPGFDSHKADKNGNIISASNEYHLFKYLEKHNELVPYYKFNRAPFQDDMDMSPKFIHNGAESEHPDYSNMDLVVAVPVCSGLSTSTCASEDTRRTRNNNMLYIANYVLREIKPKIYIFENAPTLLGSSKQGAEVRKSLEELAADTGYSVCYYKTDTILHHNCQRRPRTFVYFFKADGERKGAPQLGFECCTVNVEEYLKDIPSGATQQFSIQMNPVSDAILDYYKETYGSDWRESVNKPCLLDDLFDKDKLHDLCIYVRESSKYTNTQKERVANYVNHIYNKINDGKGFWKTSPSLTRSGRLPAIMHKTINSYLHYKEDRCYTVRELLYAMGMPIDFEMQGLNPLQWYAQIGQNVPARTAKFIVSEAVKILNNWDSVERSDKLEVAVCDNIKQTNNVIKVLDA